MTMTQTFGVLDGNPAVWIAGVSGRLFVDGAWKAIDSMELAHAAHIMPRADFEKAYPKAAQALENT